jgi:hypothetical protein
MYKTVVIFLSFAIASAKIYSQEKSVQNNIVRGIKVFEENGVPFTELPADIAGTPFFTSGWKDASVTLSDNTVYTGIPIKLNLVNQQVHFLSSKKGEIAIEPGLVKEIIFSDSLKEKTTYTFQSGFPAINNQKQNDFYLVLGDGKLKFLESVRKRIFRDQNNMTKEITQEFRTDETYYFFINDTMQPVKKSKTYVLGIMHDKENKIEGFVNKNQLSYKSATDIKKMVDYYNSL